MSLANGRTEANAPDAVRARGGVAMSLWMTGAGETDCLLVARLSERAERLDHALRAACADGWEDGEGAMQRYLRDAEAAAALNQQRTDR